MNRNIIIDLIISNTCNKVCDYCCVKFNWKLMDKVNIDYLIEFLDKNKDSYDNCIINFFWWEPLLNYENIVYFIKKNTNSKINYSIWTNWLLLNEEMLLFFKEYNVKIIITFHSDNINSYKLLLKKFLLNYENIEINFIVSPFDIYKNYEKIDTAVNFWYKKINIIPVILTQKWTKNSITELNWFIEYVDWKYVNNSNYNKLKISKYSYFDWIIFDKVFVIDYDLNIFQDSSDELYIAKQFSKIWNNLFKEIEEVSFIWNLKNTNLSFSEILNKHNVKSIFNLIYKIPKKMNQIKDYYLIYRIMNKNRLINWKIKFSDMVFWVSES